MSLLRLRRYRSIHCFRDCSTVYTFITTSGSVLFTRSPTLTIRFDLYHCSTKGQEDASHYIYTDHHMMNSISCCIVGGVNLRQCHHQLAHARDRHCIVARRLYRVPAVAALCRPPTLPYPCLGLPLSPAGRRSTREPLTPTL